MLKIAFLGNCQAGYLCKLYNRYVVPYDPAEVVHILSYKRASADDRQALSTADVIVHQIQSFNAATPLEDIRADALVYPFPVAKAGFLWPFTGRAHPANTGTPTMPTGPYPSVRGDTYLNRLIAEGMDPGAAAEHYAALDVGSLVDLDRLYRIAMAELRGLDAATGYDVAGVVERHFRTERLFDTVPHPTWTVMSYLAATLFERMGVDTTIIERVTALGTHAYVPIGQHPVHPSVARHFGMTWVTGETRYKQHSEGYVTFREWAERYMRYTWNEPLEKGILSLRTGRSSPEVLAMLREGLARSPRSGPGWFMLARQLERDGQFEEALDAIDRALEHEPDNAVAYGIRARLLERDNRSDLALDDLRRMAALDPHYCGHQRTLSQALARRGLLAEATVAAQAAVALEPRRPAWAVALADLLQRQGRTGDAATVLRTSLRFNPDDAGLRKALETLAWHTGAPGEGSRSIAAAAH